MRAPALSMDATVSAPVLIANELPATQTAQRWSTYALLPSTMSRHGCANEQHHSNAALFTRIPAPARTDDRARGVHAASCKGSRHSSSARDCQACLSSKQALDGDRPAQHILACSESQVRVGRLAAFEGCAGCSR